MIFDILNIQFHRFIVCFRYADQSYDRRWWSDPAHPQVAAREIAADHRWRHGTSTTTTIAPVSIHLLFFAFFSLPAQFLAVLTLKKIMEKI